MSARQQRPLPVADDWFASTAAGEGVTLLTEPFVDEFLRANIWLVEGRDRDLLIDTGNGIGRLSPAVDTLREGPDKPLLAVATHAHSDHMGGMHEFAQRLVHRLEAEALSCASDAACLLPRDFPAELKREIEEEGMTLPEVLVTAIPHAGFEPAAFAVTPATPTALLDEGDVLDFGDRVFTVLHLPGHSPGSIGLWEAATGILFSGDAVYRDGPLLDALPGSDVNAYIRTMHRLHDLPVKTVHGGHDPSFGRARLAEVAEAYIDEHGRA
jgi:glyoxylase-like metal-dependent hydrolase (beta-lactamase superfamily II)